MTCYPEGRALKAGFAPGTPIQWQGGEVVYLAWLIIMRTLVQIQPLQPL